jgi:hypothetical protein
MSTFSLARYSVESSFRTPLYSSDPLLSDTGFHRARSPASTVMAATPARPPGGEFVKGSKGGNLRMRLSRQSNDATVPVFGIRGPVEGTLELAKPKGLVFVAIRVRIISLICCVRASFTPWKSQFEIWGFLNLTKKTKTIWHGMEYGIWNGMEKRSRACSRWRRWRVAGRRRRSSAMRRSRSGARTLICNRAHTASHSVFPCQPHSKTNTVHGCAIPHLSPPALDSTN